jgi:hypothetical protein
MRTLGKKNGVRAKAVGWDERDSLRQQLVSVHLCDSQGGGQLP